MLNVYLCMRTHPIFSGNAANNLRNSVIDEVVVCDTIPLSE
ncbi:hypothetical protein ACLBOM_21975 [Escherichia coli]